jgi:hypothetical protein
MIETPSEILAHHASKEASDSFIAWRKKAKRPLTETAALRIAKTLAAIVAAGGDASDALGMAEERGWQTIRPDWYFKQVKAESATPAQKAVSLGDRMMVWAEAIRSGKDYLCRSIPATAARELVQAGAVTQDQCRKVSITL